jgi:hypothetical protein
MNWSGLAKRLERVVKKAGGPFKMSDGVLEVTFTIYEGVHVRLGTYSIADWPRYTYIPEELSISNIDEETAYDRVEKLLDKAEELV